MTTGAVAVVERDDLEGVDAAVGIPGVVGSFIELARSEERLDEAGGQAWEGAVELAGWGSCLCEALDCGCLLEGDLTEGW